MSIGDFMANLSGLSESDAQLFQMDHIEINEKLRTISASFSTDTFKASSLHQPKLIASTPFLVIPRTLSVMRCIKSYSACSNLWIIRLQRLL